MKNDIVNRFLVIDTETGGIDPGKHSLLSIGAVVWDLHMGTIDEFEVFIKHDNYVCTKEAQEINGFNMEKHNEKATSGKTAIRMLEDFMHKYFPENSLVPLIGHNIQFDTNFLKVFLLENGRSYNSLFSHRMIDTNSILRVLILAGKVNENVLNLTDALKFFGIKVNERHSAVDDANATAKLFEEMIELIKGI